MNKIELQFFYSKHYFESIIWEIYTKPEEMYIYLCVEDVYCKKLWFINFV